jgi:hypothetical protein
MRPLAGSRVRFGNAWATVARVYDDGSVSLVLEGEQTLVRVPQSLCTAQGLSSTLARVRAAQRRTAWAEISARRQQASLDVALHARLVTTVVQRPRERRQRRTSGASAGGGDPPEGDDDPPDEPALVAFAGRATT